MGEGGGLFAGCLLAELAHLQGAPSPRLYLTTLGPAWGPTTPQCPAGSENILCHPLTQNNSWAYVGKTSICTPNPRSLRKKLEP